MKATLVCKVTKREYENDFSQLSRCVSCKESECEAVKKIMSLPRTRRVGMTSEYDR